MHNRELCNSKWLECIKSILNETGLAYVWESQSVLNKTDIKYYIKQNLKDQFIQKWFSDIDNSSRGQFYSLFKNSFGMEKYLIKLKKKHRLQICKLRCSNIKFPIETGRWNNIAREDRLCTLL